MISTTKGSFDLEELISNIWSNWRQAIYLYLEIKLWHVYKSLLPSVKGLSIYFHVESSPSY